MSAKHKSILTEKLVLHFSVNNFEDVPRRRRYE